MKSMSVIHILALCCTPLVASLELVVLHTNDIHSRYPQANKYGGDCSEEDAQAQKCYGGIPRIVTKVKEIRDLSENVVVLNAGDNYQGTLWFYHYKGKAAAHFSQIINYDAMALGNHEFDNDIDGLVPFLENVTFPVLSCNIDATYEPTLQGLFSKSTTVTLPGGDVVGIIGYTTADTPDLAATGALLFNSEIESIREEVEKFQAQGVNKIIAVGHAGINVDQQIADEVDGIDIVVGGHTNTFLYKGDPPSNEEPYDEYPIVRHPSTDSTKNVLVVQDYAYGKYLGYLKVNFDDAGDVTSWSGNPILLDKDVAQDNETLKQIKEWEIPVKALDYETIGKTRVYLDGSRPACRLQECNIGNVITDAMVHQNMKHPDEMKWSDVSIAVMNSGGIRSSIDGPKTISVGDVMSVLPYQETHDLVEIYGSTLIKMLENSVTMYEPEDPHGRFIQVSGLRVVFDLNKPEGERVVKALAKCTNCSVPEFHPVQSDTVYTVVLPTFMAGGGDGYDMLVDERLSYHIPGDLDTDVVIEYIGTESPIKTGLEGRIMFIDLEPEEPCVSVKQHPLD
ncbi:snake venom 5'-nucleotidase-like [Ptychodera flava]|uniref:snake venom 5'-nucleotidase-like n=1 Tax=Ptychodera flava TaxID=63121 RepID=UPI00396A7485